MKPLSLKLSWFCICSIILFAGLSLADRPAKPPAAEDVVGVYIGYSNYDDFYRLDLRSDCTGYFADVAMPSSVVHKYGVSTYRITRWRLERFDLVLSLIPADSKAEGIGLKGRVGAFGVLRLEASGTTNQWQRNLVLYPEGQTQVVSQETREAIKQVEGK